MTGISTKGIQTQSSPTVYLRSDLQWEHRTVFGRDRWIIRDPLTLRFFYISQKEYDVAKSLVKPTHLQTAVANAIRAGEISELAVRKFLLELSRAGLLRVVGAKVDLAESQTLMAQSRTTAKLAASLPLRALALRIPLCDPTRWLERSRWVGRVLFSQTMLFLLAAMWLLILGTMALRWDRIESSLPSLQQAFGWNGLIAFVISYVLLKSFHEIGHALACKRFGAECHELGVYLLCFTPCLYCDVTDAWRIKNRFRRVGIAAAGMYAEMWIAAIGGLFWMFSNPGLLHAVGFSLFLLGSLGTLLINCNPLLRYDGYYILSDFFNIPNLSRQSALACRHMLQRLVSRSTKPHPVFDAPLFLLVVYGLLSWLYKLVVLAVIIWALDQFFAGYKLAEIGRASAFSILAAVALQMLFASAMGFRRLWQHPAVSRARVLICFFFVGGLIVFLCTIPYRLEIGCVGLVNTGKRNPVYADRSGILKSVLDHGTVVDEDDEIFRLESIDSELRVIELETAVEELRTRLEGLNAIKSASIELSASRETLSLVLDTLQNQLQAARVELESLVKRSSTSGRFFAAEVPPVRSFEQEANKISGLHWRLMGSDARSIREVAGQGQLRFSNVKQQGRLVQRGEVIGWIVPDREWFVDAYVDEPLIERVRVGSTVHVRLEDRPWLEHTAVVEKVNREPVEQFPELLDVGRGHGTGKLYQLRIGFKKVDLPDQHVYPVQIDQMTAYLRIESAPESLATRVRRYLAETIRW